MKNILFILLILISTSCNEEKNQSETTNHNESNITKEKASKLELKLKLRTTNADDFRVLMNKIKSENEEHINIHVSKSLKANNEIQLLSLDLEENFFPEELLLDLGKNLKTVVIEEVVFNTRDHKLTIPRKKIDHFFYPNKFLKFNKEENTYQVTEKNKGQYLTFRQRILDSLWLN